MKKNIIFIILMIPLLAYSQVSEQQLFDRIDQAIANQDQAASKKQDKIKKLKRSLDDAENDQEKLAWLDSIYQEYSTYRYDSANFYVHQGLELAERTHNEPYIIKFKINHASVLSVGGFYSQAESLMQTIDPTSLNLPMRRYYYQTMVWLYNYWLAFVTKSEFAQGCKDLKKKYIQLTLQTYQPQEQTLANYYYLMGELIYLDRPTHPSVLAYYQKAIKASGKNTRIHAASSYGVARYYKNTDRYDLYEQYLVEAIESDIICQLKETVALQKFATYIYNKDPKYSKQAAKYITISMEDAQFFNNRLRMLEISSVLPVIASANQQQAERSRSRIQIGFIIICLILCIVLVQAVVSTRRKNKLKNIRREITQQNSQLESLNKRLIETNERRETYMRLFMDISAVYIRKLEDYRKYISRKVKAKQFNDLLKAVGNYKLAEEEASTFYTRFDKAFLELYPNFVEELNTLLLPESRFTLQSPNTLTTEIRIYALMRLGVTDSQEIATLLFYSVQTIYNYKSGMRAKAINRETFEEDINKLCHII